MWSTRISFLTFTAHKNYILFSLLGKHDKILQRAVHETPGHYCISWCVKLKIDIPRTRPRRKQKKTTSFQVIVQGLNEHELKCRVHVRKVISRPVLYIYSCIVLYMKKKDDCDVRLIVLHMWCETWKHVSNCRTRIGTFGDHF